MVQAPEAAGFSKNQLMAMPVLSGFHWVLWGGAQSRGAAQEAEMPSHQAEGHWTPVLDSGGRQVPSLGSSEPRRNIHSNAQKSARVAAGSRGHSRTHPGVR